MDALSIAGFFVVGLTGSLHCAGMCGPIIWLMPFQHLRGLQRWLAIMLHHTGRIIAYTTLGALFFTLREAFDPRWQQIAALSSGALLMAFGIVSLFGAGRFAVLRPVSKLVVAGLGRLSGQRGIGYFALTGFLNGLLPCGMVYMALGLSMKGADVLHCMGRMAAFGLGTIPMLLAVTVLRRRLRFPGLKWANAVIVLCGLLVLVRGANLGIPYLSPERAPAVKSQPVLECCHKPG